MIQLYCASCGETLSGEDTNPYRHQIVEIPPISPIVIEHRLHQLTCTLLLLRPVQHCLKT
ncbi:MAG: IS66 family transposase zinc-finger binding domain-containing protein [Stigonema ocellatum SAG 48.90 = DSM 106950]|nr:IS66 family transposase zinc-finger binding domain-containing protein [Stigonema ocellatum SAG 48.90 = DSM 106950]